VSQILTSSDYQHNGTLFVTGVLFGCKLKEASDCQQLLVSHDRGQSWISRPHTGWSGAELVIGRGNGGDVITSQGRAGVLLSTDQGRSFVDMALPIGGVRPLGASPDGRLIYVTGSADDALFVVDSGKINRIPHLAQQSQTETSAVWTNDAAGLVSIFDSRTGVLSVAKWGGAISRIGTDLGPADPTVAPQITSDNGRRIAIWAANEAWLSTDNGESFQPLVLPDLVAAGMRRIAMAIDLPPIRPGEVASILYGEWTIGSVKTTDGTGGGRMQAVATGGAWSSSDGVSWHALTPTSGRYSYGVTSIRTSPDGTVLAGYVDFLHGVVAGLICAPRAGGHWASICPQAISEGAQGRSSSSVKGSEAVQVVTSVGRLSREGSQASILRSAQGSAQPPTIRWSIGVVIAIVTGAVIAGSGLRRKWHRKLQPNPR
jgi:hypothetical protein